MALNPYTLINLLAQNVPNETASTLVGKCLQLGMVEHPHKSTPDDVNLPPFDKAYQFQFQAPEALAAGFEILEKETRILQAGFQLSFPRAFLMSPAGKQFDEIGSFLQAHYGQGRRMNMAGAKAIYFESPSAVCYVSRAKLPDQDFISVRTGNRAFWG